MGNAKVKVVQRARGPHAVSYTIQHNCRVPTSPFLFPLPAHSRGNVKERPPIKKMVISLKINDPLVTKVGKLHLSSCAEMPGRLQPC